MAYKAYVTTLKNVRSHPNADRMKLADCFGNTVCVGIDAAEGEIVIYFPTDGQLSAEYAEQNNLIRKLDENGNNIGGYLESDKRNIKAIKLRGEKSDGLTMPLSSLAYTGVNLDEINVGDTIDIVNGHEICKKYIPRGNRRGGHGGGNKTRKHKVDIAPLFAEHADTEQLAYNLDAFKPNDEIEITLKMHGTSQRTGYLPILKGYDDSWYCQVRNWLWYWFNRITKKNDLYTTLDKMKHDGKPYYEYDYISGTRRVVLENYEGGYYGDNKFRQQHHDTFVGKLWKGETVYYEVVGFTDNGTPIMSSASNSKVNDKEFVKKYGDTTVFSYGCSPDGGAEADYHTENCGAPYLVKGPQSDVYVYRMTMTNEDGEVVEYTPDFMRYRCEQMGVKTVPVFAKFILHDYDLEIDTRTPGEVVRDVAEKYYDGPDPVGETHIREGVVVRVINRPKFCAYKHKNWYFKALEGLVKDTADAPDMEEAQEAQEENGREV